MKRRVLVAALGVWWASIGALGLAAADAGPGLSAAAIVSELDLVRAPAGAFSVEVAIVGPDATEAEPTARLAVAVLDAARSVARFTAPAAERGKALLMVGPDVWLRLPGATRPVRIPPLQRLVGEVAHADVLRVNVAGDYTPAVGGDELRDGRPCVRLRLAGRTDGALYPALTYWVERNTWQPVAADFHAASGLVIKRARFLATAPALGRDRPSVIELVDALRGDRRTRLYYAAWRREVFAEELFQPSYLRHWR